MTGLARTGACDTVGLAEAAPVTSVTNEALNNKRFIRRSLRTRRKHGPNPFTEHYRQARRKP
jgi:hypothetical protein